MATWKLEDAKNRFSELVRAAQRRPQVVTRHGREEVVIMSMTKYRELGQAQRGLTEFMRDSPLAEAFGQGDLELKRLRDLPRDLEL